jgi:phospholipase/lecithinase/hemolysin
MPVFLNTLNNAILRANLPKRKGHPSAYGKFIDGGNTYLALNLLNIK